jgi:AcrR family transcriptional regulator
VPAPDRAGGSPRRRPSAARDRILATAARLFYANGVRGTGVDAVVSASGVAKATLYAHFPTKADLVLAYLADVDAAWQGKLRAAAAAAGPEPRDQLVGLFDAMRVACSRDGFRGCAFINTAAESEPGGPVHQATAAHKRAVRDWVRGLAEQAGARDPDGLARSLTLLVDGALAAGALEPGGTEAAHAAQETARLLVAAACPG